jgi:hypothetical protein
MSNQNNSIPKNYSVRDMQDLAYIAKHDMAWMCTAIGHIKQEIIKLNKLAEDGEHLYDFHFADLIRHADMYEYLAEDRLNHHTKESDCYSQEWEQFKGGRNA